MENLTEYKILIAKSPNDLIEQVNQHLKDGWKPTGGVFITQSPIVNKVGGYEVVETFSHQALVK